METETRIKCMFQEEHVDILAHNTGIREEQQRSLTEYYIYKKDKKY